VLILTVVLKCIGQPQQQVVHLTAQELGKGKGHVRQQSHACTSHAMPTHTHHLTYSMLLMHHGMATNENGHSRSDTMWNLPARMSGVDAPTTPVANSTSLVRVAAAYSWYGNSLGDFPDPMIVTRENSDDNCDTISCRTAAKVAST